MPRLSILVPTYNRARYLRTCLESLAATTVDCEILVSDNASTDDTAGILEAFSRDPRFRIFRQPENIGAFRNHDVLLEAARGEFLAVFGDDDLAEPGGFEAKLAVLDRFPEIDVLYSRWFRIDGEGRNQGVVDWPGLLPHSYSGGRDEFADLLVASYIMLQGVLFRRQVYLEEGGLVSPLDLKAAMDWHMLLRFVRGRRVGFLNQPTASVRVHASSHTNAGARAENHFAQDKLRIWRHWLLEHPEPPVLGQPTWERMEQSLLGDVVYSQGRDSHEVGRHRRLFAELRAEATARHHRSLQPPAGAPVGARLPVRWIGAFLTPSGYASEAFNFGLGLQPHVDLGILNITKTTSAAFVQGLGADEQAFLQSAQRRFPTLRGGIVVSHGPAYAFQRVPDAEYHVGRTMFETDRLPPSWVERCRLMDEVWVPTRFNVETFARAGVPREKLFVIPGPVDADVFDPARHRPMTLPRRAGYNFLSVFEWHARKGWDVLLAAYFREFSAQDDVCLHLRTYPVGQVDGDPRAVIEGEIRAFVQSLGLADKALPRVEILGDPVPGRDLPSLYLAADCYVAPSRGEGWGRPQHEAMLMERPVIVTGWSGPAEFVTAETGYRLDYELVEARPTEAWLQMVQGHRWANPSESHLRATMRHVFTHRDEAREKGRRARIHMAREHGREAVTRRILDRLAEIRSRLDSRRLATPAPTRPVVAWEGSFLDHGSLSHVNRELVRTLRRTTPYALVPVGGTAAKSKIVPEMRVDGHVPTAPRETSVTVRHAWPPSWIPPVRGPWILMQPWEFGSLPSEWIRNLRKVDECWVYSQYCRQVYADSGVPVEKVHVIPLGIDPSRFNPDARPMKLATRKRFRLLFVGGTIRRKGPDLLLAAYLKSFRRSDDVCLVIKDFGGDGAYQGQTFRAAIEAAQARPDAPEILHLDTELPDADMPGLYTACDCLVHPYRGEGFGLPVLEAMACGLPVIVTAGGATEDFAVEGCAYRIPSRRVSAGNRIGDIELVAEGWLLEPDEGRLRERMRWVVEHPAEARATGERAARHVREGWTWDHSARRIQERLDAWMTAAEAPTARDLVDEGLAPTARVGSLRDAVAAEKAGRPVEAWTRALEAIQRRPFHPEAWMQMANTAVLAGDIPAALEVARRAVRLAPRWEVARDSVAQFERELAQSPRSRPSNGDSRVAWPALPPVTPPRITVCLIVRDEERFLAQCLRSVQGVASQVVVVDTGSTDRTCEIAREFGAEVHHFEWKEDFAAARNAGLEHARGDWILVLDADEELDPSTLDRLPALLADTRHLGYRLPLQDAQKGPRSAIYVPRLFRNAPGIEFLGRIHEEAFTRLSVLCTLWHQDIGLGEVGILHHGYTPEVMQSRNKVERNHRLLVQALEENPGHFGLMTQLGLELMRLGRTEEAFAQYAAAARRAESFPPRSFSQEAVEALLTQQASYLSNAGRPADVVAVLSSKLASWYPLPAALHFLKGVNVLRLGRPAEALEDLEEARRRRSERNLYAQPIDLQGPIVECTLAQVHEALQAWDEAEACYREAHALDPADVTTHLGHARLLGRRQRAREALPRLYECLQVHPEAVDLWVLGSQLALGDPELRELSVDWVTEARRLHPEDRRLLRSEGLARLRMDDAAGALGCLEASRQGDDDAQGFAELAIAAVAAGRDRIPEFPPDWAPVLTRSILEALRTLNAARAEQTVETFLQRVACLRAQLPLLVQSLEAGS